MVVNSSEGKIDLQKSACGASLQIDSELKTAAGLRKVAKEGEKRIKRIDRIERAEALGAIVMKQGLVPQGIYRYDGNNGKYKTKGMDGGFWCT